jgi:hypothetical protein
MRSPMIELMPCITDKGSYSDLKVIRSRSGLWYVGTDYNHPLGYTEPGSRDSEYFNSELEAGNALALIQEGVLVTRLRP